MPLLTIKEFTANASWSNDKYKTSHANAKLVVRIKVELLHKKKIVSILVNICSWHINQPAPRQQEDAKTKPTQAPKDNKTE